jgi:hypothetical protein
MSQNSIFWYIARDIKLSNGNKLKKNYINISSWKGKLLSLDGSLVLINLVLTNMMPYLISFLMLPKKVLHKLDYFWFKFVLQVDNEKKKYRLGKYSVVWWPKDQGGLGIYDLEGKNTALGKWLFKQLIEDDVWQTLLKRKDIGSKALSCVYWKPDSSHFLASLMATEKHFIRLWSFSIKDDSEILF